MKISIIGTGYVGLTSGVCLAEIGHQVTCVDTDDVKISNIQKGNLPIYEPNLEILLKKNLISDNIKFATDLKESISNSEVIFLALPTPENEKGLDTSCIENCVEEILEILKSEDSFKVIACKSTVPVGTNKKIQHILESRKILNIAVASNPEFLREGNAIYDFLNPDRIIIGAESQKAFSMIQKIYSEINANILFTDLCSAELIKLASNSLLATKISFINSLAIFSEKIGANIDLVSKGIGLDSRIGKHFLQAGIGYGGSCFPKDIRALALSAKEYGTPLDILEKTLEINTKQRLFFLEKIRNRIKSFKGKKIALWGLAFKQETDDIRESVAIYLAQNLLKEGAEIFAWDPKAIGKTEAFGNLKGKISYAKEMYECLDGADLLIIATEWEEFSNADLLKIKEKLKSPLLFDGRNILQRKNVEKAGIEYWEIGKVAPSNES